MYNLIHKTDILKNKLEVLTVSYTDNDKLDFLKYLHESLNKTELDKFMYNLEQNTVPFRNYQGILISDIEYRIFLEQKHEELNHLWLDLPKRINNLSLELQKTKPLWTISP